MRFICPNCEGTFEAQFLCPKCGVQLLDPRKRQHAEEEQDEDSRPLRLKLFVAGVVLTLGLYGGATELQLAAVRVFGEPSQEWADGYKLLPVILVGLAALAGGVIAAAVRQSGVMPGAISGLAASAALAAVSWFDGDGIGIRQLFPAGAAIFCGAIGGWIGARRWPPAYIHPVPTPRPKAAKPIPLPSDPLSMFRVMAAAALATGCTVWAGWLRDHLVVAGGGVFGIGSHIQGHFIAWVIAALAMILGSIYAGSGTRNGATHGMLTGLAACATIFIIHLQVVKEPLPAERFFVAIAGFADPDVLSHPRTALFLISNMLPLGVAGGWLGATLLPRTVAAR
jgi:hypothetical protein